MDVVYIDIEASGLGAESYPIEIAWRCVASGDSDDFYINPESEAAGWDYWDEFAEELHGIERETLLKDGVGIFQACMRLNTALKGKTIVSDAFEFDAFWMRRLFQQADITPLFSMAGLEYLLTSEQLIQYRFIARSQYRRHRAMQDVDDLIKAVNAVIVELD
ncbi:MAG: hypothetical protein ACPGF7_03455 [Pontibacterium sp.]